MPDQSVPPRSRRRFLQSSSVLASAALALAGLVPLHAALGAPAVVTADAARPAAEQGVWFGDPTYNGGIVWSRSDRAARMLVDVDLDPGFGNARKITGPHALPVTDYTARVDLTGLPSGREVFVRVTFEDLTNARARSEPVTGSFKTATREERDVNFVWGGDTAGQGWGINPDFGGMKIYESMRRVKPDFFIHSGDNVYADGRIAATVTAESGRIWRNIVTPDIAKVAETIDEFRGRYKYNLLDTNVRRFNADVAQIWQWDDHEVVNNWSASKDLSADARFTVKDVPLLIAAAAGPFSSTRRYGHLMRARAIVSTAMFPTAACSTSSSSICAAIVDRTASTARPPPVRTPIFSERSNSRGSSAA